MKKIIAMAVTVMLLCCIAVSGAAKHGLSKEEIRTIQQKLKNWGYYNGQADGIYGQQTTAAVKYFQQKNGLTADGIVGSRTAEKLGMQLSSTPKQDVSQDVYLLAKAVYGEARGEPYRGQVAVAAVILNRVESGEFPNSIHGVIYQKGAFSIVADGQINLAPDANALSAAQDALSGVDPTGGCLFYYNPEKTKNQYMLSKPVFTVIGRHAFCK